MERKRPGVAEIDRVFIAFPLFLREHATPWRVAVGICIIRAKSLRGNGVSKSPIVTSDLALKALGGVSQIDGVPMIASLWTTAIDSVKVSRVIADKEAGQARVKTKLFDVDFNRGVLSPVETKEASQEVFCSLKHTILGCCTGDDLCRGVVQLAILVEVVHSGVEHPTTLSVWFSEGFSQGTASTDS